VIVKLFHSLYLLKTELSFAKYFIIYFQELFIQEISKEAYIFTSQSKRKTVQRKDLGKSKLKMEFDIFYSDDNN